MIGFILLGVLAVAGGILGMVFTGKARGIKARERQDTTSAGGR
jgi:hypothetical protein